MRTTKPGYCITYIDDHSLCTNNNVSKLKKNDGWITALVKKDVQF